MRSFLALAALLVAAAPAAPAGTLSGTLGSPGVVWVTDGSKPAPFNGAIITQKDKAFYPPFAVVPVGSTVEFRNDDEVEHSVYSVSDGDPFDLGIYQPGPGKSVTFAAGGVVAIRCHIHRSMRTTLVVVDGPYTRMEAAGAWTLTGLRAGRHVLHTWTATDGEQARAIEVR